MKEAFLICPVRGVDTTQSQVATEELEADGWHVHWPPRDTNQDDVTGFRICSDNLEAIRKADRVFIIWDGQSKGCLFDAGIAFALGKPITCLDLPTASEGKSFQNMMRQWQSLA